MKQRISPCKRIRSHSHLPSYHPDGFGVQPRLIPQKMIQYIYIFLVKTVREILAVGIIAILNIVHGVEQDKNDHKDVEI